MSNTSIEVKNLASIKKQRGRPLGSTNKQKPIKNLQLEKQQVEPSTKVVYKKPLKNLQFQKQQIKPLTKNIDKTLVKAVENTLQQVEPSTILSDTTLVERDSIVQQNEQIVDVLVEKPKTNTLEEPPIKRGRGRPKKSIPELDILAVAPVKRGRGRPPGPARMAEPRAFGTPAQKKPLRKNYNAASKKLGQNTKLLRSFGTPDLKYAFLNVLQGRNLTSAPNICWGLDFTVLDTALEGYPKSKHYALVVLDSFARKCIAIKVFSIINGKGSVKTEFVINLLTSLIQSRNVEQSVQKNKTKLIIHTDNGPEFTSKRYHDFIDQHPLLIGSTSKVACPSDNAVVERFNRHFKQESYTTAHTPTILTENPNLLILPKEVSSTEILQAWVDAKREYLNKYVPNSHNGQNPPDLEEHLNCFTLAPIPGVALAKREYYKKQTPEFIANQEYRTLSRVSVDSEVFKNKMYTENTTTSTLAQKFLIKQSEKLVEQNDTILSVLDKMEKQIQALQKKPKRRHQTILRRAAANKEVFKDIFKARKPKYVHQLAWDRFKIIATLLFYSGARSIEIADFTEKHIQTIINTQQLTIVMTKTNTKRLINFAPEAVAALKKLHKERLNVFPDETTVLYKSYSLQSSSLVRMVNTFLHPFAQKHNLKLSTHSFRINYVTKALTARSPEFVKTVMGHKKLESTLLYNRTEVTPNDQQELVNQMFKDDTA